jgi:hypothetical protein
MGYKASSKRMVVNVKLGRKWWPFLGYYSRIFLKGLSKTMKNPRIVTLWAKNQSTRYEAGMRAFNIVTILN